MPNRLPQGRAWDILQYEALRNYAEKHRAGILFWRYAPATLLWIVGGVAALVGVVFVVRWVQDSGITGHWPEVVAAVALVVVAFVAFRPRGRRARMRTRQARARRLR